jgi:hypothetical protein
MTVSSVLDPRLMSTLTMLQRDPRCYRGFGWLWWTVKAALKAQVTPAELYLLGAANDPVCVQAAAAEYGSGTAALDAALDHYAERAYGGLVFASDDHLPDGRAVRITDPDAGHANIF